MKISIASTLRNYNKKNIVNDIISGLIIAAISIPISMGYAQISGLPAVYGLYGSVFPILFFAFFSTSYQFVFGVDAAPAALVGSSLLTMGVATGSEEAMRIVPEITFFVALWLFVFFLLKTGKLVNYISTPVMGGFISGICTTVILMQVPKLLGGPCGTGELFELLRHIYIGFVNINVPSLVLGISTLIILLLFKKFIPKLPVAIFAMVIGAILTAVFHIDKYGIVLLAEVKPGLPKFIFPDFTSIHITEALGVSLPIAIVIMAQTLLAENNFATKNGYKLNDNQEILAFSMGNFASAFIGGCPINGSVSRTVIGEQYGGKTQVMGITAGLSMVLLLLFGTDFISYLPVPVLTAIVIFALMGACEFKLAKKLIKVSREEFYIFVGAFLGVLILGTIYGVVVGILLSFVSVIRKAADPPRCFLGVLPGHDELFNMSKYKHIYPIQNVVIYRFSGNLFFANVSIFQKDIEDNIKSDTKAVIVDAGGIVSIDVTAVERIEVIYNMLKKKGIRFYITEHIAALNDQMRALGIGWMIEEGAVRRTITTALEDIGIAKPYPLYGAHNKNHSLRRKKAESSAQEFVWAFGDEAEEKIEKHIHRQIEALKKNHNLETITHGLWTQMESFDEDEWLQHLEAHLSEIVKISDEDEVTIAGKIEHRRKDLLDRIEKEHPDLAKRFIERRHVLDEHLKEHYPEIYEKIIQLRNEI